MRRHGWSACSAAAANVIAGKRPLMGAIAERAGRVVIVTDDNPRGEDGDAIVAQIVAGLRQPRAR